MATVIEKVYSLKAIGGKDTYETFDKLNKILLEIKKNKIDLNTIFQQSTEPKVLSETAKKLDELKIKEKEISVQIKELNLLHKQRAEFLANEAAAQDKLSAEEKKRAADAKKAASDKEKADKKADADRDKAAKQAQKDADQVVRDEKKKQDALQKTADKLKAIADAKAAADALKAANAPLPGTYNDIAAQYKALQANVKNTVNLSDDAALKKATDDLLALRTQLDSFNRSLTHDKVLIGEYTSGIAKAFHQLGLGHLVKEQVDQAKAALQNLNADFVRLVAEMEQVKTTGVGSLDALERQLIENRTAANGLEQQLQGVQHELKAMGGIGTQMAEKIGTEFGNIKEQFVQFVVSFVGFQQTLAGLGKAVDINYKLSDSMSDIQNRMHGTDEDVQSLVDHLKELDTRSSLASLVDIGALISKKGVAKEEIDGVTKSIDNLMVALDGEIGDPHEAVSSLIKLVNVYSEDKHVTASNIDAIGGAIARLTTSGVATGAFLIDFAERMGGIRGVTGLTIDSVLGLGAGLEELGQRTETSATAMSQLVVKMFTEAQRYADILGVSLTTFEKMLRKDVLGTFVKVAESLKGNADEMEHFFEGVQDMHTKGARVVGVLGDIAANADYARKRMVTASQAMKEQGIVAEMAANKQHNFAASVDRINKAFELFYSSKGFMTGLKTVTDAVLVLLNNLPTLIKLGSLILAGWVAQNFALLVLRAQLIGYNIALGTYRTLLGITTILQAAYAASLGVVTGAYSLAAGAASLFNSVLAVSPIGAAAVAITALVGVAALLTTGIYYMTEAINGNSAALTAHGRELMLNQQIANKVNEKTTEQIGKIKMLTNVINSNTSSLESKKHALTDLIGISPKYLESLTLENIKTKEGTDLISKYIDALKRKSAYEAAAAIQSEQQREDIRLQTMEYNLEQKKAAGKTNNDDLSEDEAKYLGAVSRNAPFVSSLVGMRGGFYGKFLSGGTFLDEALDNIKKRREEIKKELDVTNKVVEDKFNKMDHITDIVDSNPGYGKKERTIGDIEKDIKNTKVKLRHAIEGSKEAIALHKQLLALKAELRAAVGSAGSGHGSRLSVEEYEESKVINANRDNKITALRVAYNEEEATRKVFNGRMIDNERTFQEEMQKIEEGAIAAKVKLIAGNKPAEQQARAKYRLDLLESQKAYADKFYKMDLDQLNAAREEKATAAKDILDNVDNNSQATDLERATAKLDYYNALQAQYIDYMAAMDALEKKYHKQSEKNTADRNRMLQEMERQQGKSLLAIQRTAIENEMQEINSLYEQQMRDVMKKRMEGVAGILSNPNMSAARKQRKIDRLNESLEKETLNVSDQNIARELELNQFLFDNKLIQAKEYYAKLDELKKGQLDNSIRRNDLEINDDARTKKIRDAAVNGSFEIFRELSSSYLQMLQQQDALKDKQATKEMEWNRKVRDSQVQSNAEKLLNDKVYALQQEQMEKNKLARNKEMAKAQMAIDYALGVMKIWVENAANPIIAGIETGILSAVYFGKLAMMDRYEQGGQVPSSGGQFGGNSHSNGGTPFNFKGRMFEAEADELAIINKRSARSNDVLSLSGTPKQIASGLNAYGGGKNFAPGAKMYRFEYGGTLGAQVQLPSFIANRSLSQAGAGRGGDQNAINDIYQLVMANAHAMSSLKDHVTKIQVVLNPNHVTSHQDNQMKLVKVGSL